MASSENIASEANNDKFSGQLIIKAQLGDDIRKMMIHNEDLTLNELILMMERVFAGKISNSDEITIKYVDDDGDKITLLNDSDLTVALHFHKCLRLFVLVNGRESFSNNGTGDLSKEENSIDTKLFLNELQEIRNAVQTIVDRLQSSKNEIPTIKETTTTTTSATTTLAASPAAVVSSTARELDPYKNLQQQQQQQQRSTTPDTNQSSSNYLSNNQQQAAPTGDSQQADTTNTSNLPSANFQQASMPAPYFVQAGLTNYQQVKPNAYGPPPSFSNLPPLPNAGTSQYPPVSSPTANTPPTFSGSVPQPSSSVNQSSGFMGQQAAGPPPQGGFYGQQQALFQQRPPGGNFNPSDPYAQSQSGVSTSNSAPATINPSFVQAPPMASQQPYGAYPPQNAYYNPGVQQYPKTS